jgi:hypothetical protein
VVSWRGTMALIKGNISSVDITCKW